MICFVIFAEKVVFYFAFGPCWPFFGQVGLKNNTFFKAFANLLRTAKLQHILIILIESHGIVY